MDRLYEIALTLLPSVGCKNARLMTDVYECAENLFRQSESDLRKQLGKHEELIRAILSKETLKRAEEELNFAAKNSIRVLYYTDPEYPQRLNLPDCEDTPTILYYRGTADLNPQRALAVVGSRKATDYGKSMTTLTLNGLCQEEVLIVSGLAYGIDAAAHRAALANGLPTVGVVAHGLDMIYPAQNRSIANQMVCDGGGVITEYPSKTQISPAFFPARNRIIAAMSDAVLVAEASLKGGALITANLAFGYHRDIFAFPGRIGDPYSSGCNRMIAANKAVLVENGDDIMNAMTWEKKSLGEGKQTNLFVDLTPDEKTLMNLLLDSDGMSLEELKEKSKLSMSAVVTSLLSMELKGACHCCPGKIYRAH